MAGNTGEWSKTMSRKDKYLHISWRMLRSNSVLSFFYLTYIVLFTYLIVMLKVNGIEEGKIGWVSWANPFLGTIGGMLAITSTVLALRREKLWWIPRLLMFPLVMMQAVINDLWYDLIKWGIMLIPFFYQIYEWNKGSQKGQRKLSLKFRNLNKHQYFWITVIAATLSAIIGWALTKAPNYSWVDDKQSVAYMDAFQFIFTVLGAFFAARTNVAAQFFFGVSNIFAMTLSGLTALWPGIITNIIFLTTSIFGFITWLDDYNKQQKRA